MIEIQLTETIAATCEEFLDLVMNIERYAEVDRKIRPVLWSRRDGNRVEFACRPKLGGLRQPKIVQFVELTPGSRIDIGLLPKPANRLAHAMAEFNASFRCEATPEGTRVTRTLRFDFVPAVRWFAEPLLRKRLGAEVLKELRCARAVLEKTEV